MSDVRTAEAPAAEDVRRLLSYDERTGLLRWAIDRGGFARAGHAAGTVHPDGYLSVKLGGRCFLAHRLIWLWVHGRWPVAEIDHVNGCRSDNRLDNLREATNPQNQANKPYPSTLGLPRGVRRQKSGRYQAQIQVGRVKRGLGTFDTAEQALAAYERAAAAVYGEFVHGSAR